MCAAARNRRGAAQRRRAATRLAGGGANLVDARRDSAAAREWPSPQLATRADARATGSRRRQPGPPAGRARAPGRRSSPAVPPLPQEGRERTEPVALRRDRDVTDAGRREARDQRAPLVRRCDRETLPQAPVSCVHAQLTARFRVDQAKLTDIGKLLLAWIANLDGQHGMAAGEPQQRRPPVERPAKVRDDNDERALARDLVRELECVAQRTGAGRREITQQMQRVEQRTPALPRAFDGRRRSERDRAEP